MMVKRKRDVYSDYCVEKEAFDVMHMESKDVFTFVAKNAQQKVNFYPLNFCDKFCGKIF